MIRLKQKKAEEEKKAAADAEKQAEENASSSIDEKGGASASVSNDVSDSNAAGESGLNSSSGGGLKLLGIGGKSTRTNGEAAKTTGKKKTPGEIRIQKGRLYVYPLSFSNRQIYHLNILTFALLLYIYTFAYKYCRYIGPGWRERGTNTFPESKRFNEFSRCCDTRYWSLDRRAL